MGGGASAGGRHPGLTASVWPDSTPQTRRACVSTSGKSFTVSRGGNQTSGLCRWTHAAGPLEAGPRGRSRGCLHGFASGWYQREDSTRPVEER